MKRFVRFGVPSTRCIEVVCLVLCLLILALASSAGASATGYEVTINSPTSGQTVSGTVAVNVSLGPDVYWDQLQVDGVAVLSGAGNFSWNSKSVPDGSHTLTVRVFKSNGTSPLGTASISVNVKNSQPVATPTPTPPNVGNEVTINSPFNGHALKNPRRSIAGSCP